MIITKTFIGSAMQLLTAMCTALYGYGHAVFPAIYLRKRWPGKVFITHTAVSSLAYKPLPVAGPLSQYHTSHIPYTAGRFIYHLTAGFFHFTNAFYHDIITFQEPQFPHRFHPF